MVGGELSMLKGMRAGYDTSCRNGVHAAAAG